MNAIFIKTRILVILFFSYSIFCFSHEYRNLLQNQADFSFLKRSLILNQNWVSYPDYLDRKGWDELTGNFKTEIIKRGEESLNYEWKVVKLTDYLEFERSGSRQVMETPYNSNITALSNLIYAELAEGKGRFMDQIINGVWTCCEMTSWALSAHLPAFQSSGRSLPHIEEQVIDLTAGDLGSLLSWTWYFFRDEMHKIDPVVSIRFRDELQKRILDPYMERSDFWWQAFYALPQTMVNNWNPWCNFNVLTCFLLLENDQDKLAKAVYRTMVSVDKFINYSKGDGACEEGTGYWGHAAGKMYDYLQLLSDATENKITIFDHPLIRKMGEYIVNSYIGENWVVNFADASPKGGGDTGLIFRYGKAVDSNKMMGFASYLYNTNHKKLNYAAGRDIYRTLENLKYYSQLVNTQPVFSPVYSVWYPETELCYTRNKSGFFFAAKGGHNAESHNHNDVGSFLLYYKNQPLFIDVGVGTYTRQTFSEERYSIWTMQSDYHNIPKINGKSQKAGVNYRSKDVKYNETKNQFSIDISGAYPQDANVESWIRTYTLGFQGGLEIKDKFILKKVDEENRINFMSMVKPDVSLPGRVIFEMNQEKIQLFYDKKQFMPEIEEIILDDPRLFRTWGNVVYRLILVAKEKKRTGDYKFSIVPFTNTELGNDLQD